jgi:hypothetical protein
MALAETQDHHPNCIDISSAFGHVLPANILLAKVSHIAKLKVKRQKDIF